MKDIVLWIFGICLDEAKRPDLTLKIVLLWKEAWTMFSRGFLHPAFFYDYSYCSSVCQVQYFLTLCNQTNEIKITVVEDCVSNAL